MKLEYGHALMMDNGEYLVVEQNEDTMLDAYTVRSLKHCSDLGLKQAREIASALKNSVLVEGFRAGRLNDDFGIHLHGETMPLSIVKTVTTVEEVIPLT